MISFLASTRGLTQENLPSNLVLDEPQIVVINKVEHVAFDANNYETILKLYTFYQEYVTKQILFDEMVVTYEEEIDILNDKLRLKKLEVQTIDEDRKSAYNKLDSLLEAIEKEERKNKIKIGLWTGGGLIVGTGIGILIGFFAR